MLVRLGLGVVETVSEGGELGLCLAVECDHRLHLACGLVHYLLRKSPKAWQVAPMPGDFAQRLHARAKEAPGVVSLTQSNPTLTTGQTSRGHT